MYSWIDVWRMDEQIDKKMDRNKWVDVLLDRYE